MLMSLALMFLIGFCISGIFKKMHIPSLLGLIITGIVLGPAVLNLLDPKILSISSELREIALIVILFRAGLNLDLSDMKKIGRPAIMLCFVPASFEIVGAIILGPACLGLTRIDSAIIGAMLAAASPAIIVPKMLWLMEEGYGTDKHIPQLIMAGASADDIYAIVMFTAFIGMSKGEGISAWTIISIPISIVTGLAVGIVFGIAMSQLFKRIHLRDTIKILLLFGMSFLFVGCESYISKFVPFSGLLAVMALGGTILNRRREVASRLSAKIAKIWVGAELLLFIMLGSAVEIKALLSAGLGSVLLILGALLFRSIGVIVSLLGSGLTLKEILYCDVAYFPKATVQAAVGAIPLAQGLACGMMVLTTAVLSILITAPLGAILMDVTVKKWLTRSKKPHEMSGRRNPGLRLPPEPGKEA
ncbi:MAG: cation:proton antiporter [Clostridiales bacterium]|nr:cation:proton antiporter [Clostridiales bacterium]